MGGALITLAIHAHDILCYVVGPVQSVMVRLQTAVNPIETEDTVAATLEMTDGVIMEHPAKTIDQLDADNRFAVLPMEGCDGTVDGHPTELTTRRWQRFGLSGAKLIWGGEAVAVRHDGRANPNQLMLNEDTAVFLQTLRQTLVDTHEQHHQRTDDLLVGLQLTHSGRFARPEPDHKLRPSILYHHPLLDDKFGLPDDYPLMTDDAIRLLIADFVKTAVLAQQIGFDFVDLKHCHGYLGHEFLTAFDRAGAFGGSFENRTRFLRELVAGVRQHAPGLGLGVRLSAFDWVPFTSGEDGIGHPATTAPYPHAFGGDGTGLDIDLREPIAFLNLLQYLNISLVCITVGSPYYVPHIQRPALFPPSGGYLPPEDPLVGVARQIGVTDELKRRLPNLLLVGSGYSYLQKWLPADVLAGKKMQRKLFCRTFSDCTTASRHGMVSGCYPLDDFLQTAAGSRTGEDGKSGDGAGVMDSIAYGRFATKMERLARADL